MLEKEYLDFEESVEYIKKIINYKDFNIKELASLCLNKEIKIYAKIPIAIPCHKYNLEYYEFFNKIEYISSIMMIKKKLYVLENDNLYFYKRDNELNNIDIEKKEVLIKEDGFYDIKVNTKNNEIKLIRIYLKDQHNQNQNTTNNHINLFTEQKSYEKFFEKGIYYFYKQKTKLGSNEDIQYSSLQKKYDLKEGYYELLINAGTEKHLNDITKNEEYLSKSPENFINLKKKEIINNIIGYLCTNSSQGIYLIDDEYIYEPIGVLLFKYYKNKNEIEVSMDNQRSYMHESGYMYDAMVCDFKYNNITDIKDCNYCFKKEELENYSLKEDKKQNDIVNKIINFLFNYIKNTPRELTASNVYENISKYINKYETQSDKLYSSETIKKSITMDKYNISAKYRVIIYMILYITKREQNKKNLNDDVKAITDNTINEIFMLEKNQVDINGINMDTIKRIISVAQYVIYDDIK